MHSACWDTVNTQALRIPLEYILVLVLLLDAIERICSYIHSHDDYISLTDALHVTSGTRDSEEDPEWITTARETLETWWENHISLTLRHRLMKLISALNTSGLNYLSKHLNKAYDTYCCFYDDYIMSATVTGKYFSGADPGFPVGGAPTRGEGGHQYTISQTFPKKRHEIEKTLGRVECSPWIRQCFLAKLFLNDFAYVIEMPFFTRLDRSCVISVIHFCVIMCNHILLECILLTARKRSLRRLCF